MIYYAASTTILATNGSISLRGILILLAGLAGAWSPVSAQTTGAVHTDTQTVEKEQVRPTLTIGRFEIKDNRPRANVTAKVTFTLHLALASSTDVKTVRQLENWKHRLRDQVITAMRKTAIKDFLEPDLHLLSRNILLRINRLLKVPMVEEILITEFAFTTH
ncbi:MAG: hypothetical protein MI725_15340 [Pirellulales bacterium]|nr:hypothetical protein [Pirellulales bacterium]